LNDCAGTHGNNGCRGGLSHYALAYIKDNGIVLESEYPYVGKN
jgi:hypothetical protein